MPKTRIKARLTTHNGKPYYRVIIPKELGGGRRFFEKKKDADEFAEIKEHERRGTYHKLFTLPESDLWAVAHAVDLLKERRSEVVDAVKFYLAHNVREQRTLAQAIEECVDAKIKTRKRHRYTSGLRNALLRFADGRESMPVHAITLKDCDAWINAPEAKAVDTRRSRQIDLGTFFSFCLKRGYIAKKPTDGVEKIKRVRQSPTILTVAQCRAVLKAAAKEHNGDLLATVALQLFGGLRPYESYRVWREMIKGRQLRLDETITKLWDVRIITINPTLNAWLNYAFKIGSKLPAWDAPKRMTDIRVASGVQPWPSDCLRDSFVSYHMEIYGWEKTIEQAGHSLATSFRHYRALTTKAEARKFWALRP